MPLYTLAIEDELSEAIGLKMISRVAPNAELALAPFRRGGNSYLRSNIGKFVSMCRSYSVVMMTDLDHAPCAGALLTNWLGSRTLPANFFLRIAVQEVESWLLADPSAMERLLGDVASKIPENCDSINNPKQLVLQLARRAARDVRADLCADPGAMTSQGLGYNRRLCELVREEWDPIRAARRSASLQKACLRLAQLR
jgi:Domain of unknown function (DUF4276)